VIDRGQFYSGAEGYCATDTGLDTLENGQGGGQDATLGGEIPVFNAGEDCPEEEEEDEEKGDDDDDGAPPDPCDDTPGDDCQPTNDGSDEIGDPQPSDNFGEDGDGGGSLDLGDGQAGTCADSGAFADEQDPLSCEDAGCDAVHSYSWDHDDDEDTDTELCYGILTEREVAGNGDACSCGYQKCGGDSRPITVPN